MHILLADDHGLVREALASLLRIDGAYEISEVDTLGGALTKLEAEPDKFGLVLLDYDMPGMNGLEGLVRMRAAFPDVPVAMLTGSVSATLAKQALSAGAAGFLPKTFSARGLAAAIAFIRTGSVFAPYDLMMEDTVPAASKLTGRETDVLVGLRQGKSNKEIARDLDLQEVTIKLHVKTLCRKLGAKNRTQAVLLAGEDLG